MASVVVLRRKAISDHLNKISISARYTFAALNLGHAKSTNLLDSRTSSHFHVSKKNVMVNSAFGLFRSICYINIASGHGIGKPESGFITTTSRFISYDPAYYEEFERRRLVNMCKYVGITAYGTDEYLRFMLRERLKSIEKDDKLIQKKGVELLSEAELRKYCRERGICAGEEMRQQVFEQIL